MINKIFVGIKHIISAYLGTLDVDIFLGNDRKYPLCEISTAYTASDIVESYYETDRPFRLETMLHNKFKDKNVIGEWFEMNGEDIRDFKESCRNFQNIIDSLKENPYF